MFQRAIDTPVPSLRLTGRSMADSFPDGPTPAPSMVLFSLAPTIEPTMAPIVSAIQQRQDSSILPWLNFCVYVMFTILILGLMVYINSKKNPSLNTERDRPTIVSVRTLAMLNAQQNEDQVRSVTPEERMEYLTNILKTQKFVDPEGSSLTKSRSFCLKQSSPSRINKDDSDLESTASMSGERPSCAICLDRFSGGEDICSAQNKDCPHEFHLECIFPWLLKSQDCPCCRRDYLTWEKEEFESAGHAETNANS